MSADILRILVVLLGVAVVAIVLVQQPKDGGISAFTGGGGASGTVFGAKGSGSFLFRLTAGLTIAFAIAIIALVKVTNSDLGGDILSTEPTVTETSTIPGQTENKKLQEAVEIPGSTANTASETLGTADKSVDTQPKK